MNRELVRDALRAPLLSMVAATTGVIALSSTTSGYARSSGIFDKADFAIGMEVQPDSFPQNTPGVITSFSDTTMAIKGGRTVSAEANGRALTVGLPSQRVWVPGFTEQVGVPFVEDELSGGPRSRDAIGDSEEDHTGIYYVRTYCVGGQGDEAIDRYTQAILALYPIDQTQVLSDGSVLRIRGAINEVAPTAAGSPLDYNSHWRVLPVSIPWRLTVNPL